MTKNLLLIALTCTIFFACSKDDEQDELATCEEFLWGGSTQCNGGNNCVYIIRVGKTEANQREVVVDKKTADYYSAKFDAEEDVCYIGSIE
jgi:hypothetical protein